MLIVVQTLVTQRSQAGKHVSLVDMSHALTASDYYPNDNLHPNDGGYAKMAQLWYNGIANVIALGWIKAPVSTTPVACPRLPTWIQSGQIANGAGNGQDVFPDGSTSVHFADLNGDGQYW